MSKRNRNNNNTNIHECAICYGDINPNTEVCLVCNQVTQQVTQHCFHDSCVYTMIRRIDDIDEFKCPICRTYVTNVTYEKETLTLNKFEEKIKESKQFLDKFLINFKFLLKKYINYNETNINGFNNSRERVFRMRERVFRMIFIINELIERMIFYYGVTRGYNISIADSELIKQYDYMVEEYRTYPQEYERDQQEYSYEFNARGELINLLNSIRNGEFPTVISSSTFNTIIFNYENRIKYPNDDGDPYIIYKDEDNRLGYLYPISIKIDPTIWNSAEDQYKIIPNNEIKSSRNTILGSQNCIWMILKLNQLKKEIEKILNYFSRDSIPEYDFITEKYTLFLEKLLVWFKEECKLDDEGSLITSNKYYFTIPNMNVLSRMSFEEWFNTIFRNATGYNSVEQVCIYTLIENIRTFLPRSSSNSKRRRIGGTKKRRRTKRKRNKRKKNLKKSYKK